MDKREEALQKALRENESQTEHWETYKKENNVAIDNLDMLSQHLSVDIMVPIGSKAFAPGKLIHTNEVIVGHYQGYFSKCSAHIAKSICEYRISVADEHLGKLCDEAKLWENKLNTPYTEGALPKFEEREIIEDYDEEKEKLWRIEHKKRVRKEKLTEKQRRETEQSHVVSSPTKSDEDIFKMLEEAEIMEELENELENMDMNNDENMAILNKLLNNEIETTQPKERIAHNLGKTNSEELATSALTGNVDLKVNKKDVITNVKESDEVDFTSTKFENELDKAEYSAAAIEVANIRKQAEFLEPRDQIGFYEYQMQIVYEKIAQIRTNNQEDIENKIVYYSVLDQLEELLETAEQKTEDDLAKEGKDNKEFNQVNSDVSINPVKSRISFALEDRTLEFNKHETVDMLLGRKRIRGNNSKKSTRDIVRLDDKTALKAINTDLEQPNEKKFDVLERVEKSVEQVKEQQSRGDFNLIDRIIGSSQANNTLHIKFTHSTNDAHQDSIDPASDIPCTPADIYNNYIKHSFENKAKVIYTNSYVGEEQVRVPFMSDAQRENAYKDKKAEFSTPAKNLTSILTNKDAVMRETHLPTTPQSKVKKSQKKSTEEYASAYVKVMNDVIEKPDPLPNTQFIDAHAPKKRISRFKQLRTGNQ